eukprot:7070808-Ditylum_brightwellii.AAC.1
MNVKTRTKTRAEQAETSAQRRSTPDKGELGGRFEQGQTFKLNLDTGLAPHPFEGASVPARKAQLTDPSGGDGTNPRPNERTTAASTPHAESAGGGGGSSGGGTG